MQNTLRKLMILVALFAMTVPFDSHLEASTASSNGELDDFREAFLGIARTLDRAMPPGHEALAPRVAVMTEEELAYLYHAVPQPRAFPAIAKAMERVFQPSTAPLNPGVKGYSGVNDGPFDPVGYPSGSSYETLVATLDGFGLLSDASGDGELADERCDPNGEATSQIVAHTLTAAAIAAQTLCDTVTVALGAASNNVQCVAAGIANAAAFAADVVIDQCDFQDGAVDSAEIEALYENTVQLLAAVTCKQPRNSGRGMGCNGLDTDCDGTVDEDHEDLHDPDLHVDRAVTFPWFDSVSEAEAAVGTATRVSDDCDPTPQLSVAKSGGTCESTEITVVARDDAGNPAIDVVEVRVDTDIPNVECSTAKDRLFSAPGKMVDVGFSYSASDACDSEPPVRVTVTSNETSGANGPDALIRRDVNGDITGVLLRAERDVSGGGRVYEIKVEATDPSGKVGFALCRVDVPQSPNSQVQDDGARFDVTR